MARLLTEAGKKVLVVEKRNEIGGNCATKDMNGITVHVYGPHIFHTSDVAAWEFINKYSETYPFINSPLANFHGKIYHMPFNMNTFHELWGVETPQQAKDKIWEETEKENIGEPKNLEEQAISMVGRTIYETLIKGYTEKQWGKDCKDLPASIIKRLPLRFEYNNNYFNDTYQCEVKGGFSKFIENLLEGIEVRLVSIMDTEKIVSSHKVTIIADGRFDTEDYSGSDMLFIPGGMPGVTNMLAHDGLIELIRKFNADGKRLAAVCAGPSVLGKAGALEGKKATCFPGWEDKLNCGEYTGAGVTTDGLITTGRGLGFTIEEGLELIKILKGEEASEDIKRRIQHPETI